MNKDKANEQFGTITEGQKHEVCNFKCLWPHPEIFFDARFFPNSAEWYIYQYTSFGRILFSQNACTQKVASQMNFKWPEMDGNSQCKQTDNWFYLLGKFEISVSPAISDIYMHCKTMNWAEDKPYSITKMEQGCPLKKFHNTVSLISDTSNYLHCTHCQFVCLRWVSWYCFCETEILGNYVFMQIKKTITLLNK